ncbi:MAG: DUF1501 domain-containing protein [Gammaproteobacteria bacterium]|nr:DUF1501 domain-containing protein [Gammaproteobacteria bacterium]
MKSTAASLLAAQCGGIATRAYADLPLVMNSNMIVQCMLLGGPDFRHFFPPAFDPTPGSFGREFFSVRASAYQIEDTPEAAESLWNTGFDPVNGGGVDFGIMQGLDWLKTMWDQGNVALIENVAGATSRDHQHAQLVWESSDRTLTQLSRPDTGWGGRLADAGDGKVVSLTPSPRLFCLHRHPDDPSVIGTQRIVTLTDPANIGLFRPDSTVPFDDVQRGITRSLTNYYAAKDANIAPGSPNRVFVDHQLGLEELGDLVRPRFSSFTEPTVLTDLYTGPNALTNVSIGTQFRNLYYAMAAGDLMNLNTVSMAHGGFDSHDNQKAEIENKFFDLFGTGGAMDTLYQLMSPTISQQVVFAFSGEFGRQLKANGGNGTDHGLGNTVLLVGLSVNGGVYGEMFPPEELDRLDEPTPDIEGRTALDAVFAELAEWAVPGSSAQVFPGLAGAPVESGVNLTALMTG